MKISIFESTTLHASFEEDLAAYRAAGVGGIGILESKLGVDGVEKLRESGLVATGCAPAVSSILPLRGSTDGPTDQAERVAALCAGVRRLAELEPAVVVFATGPGSERRAEVIEGIKRIEEAAAAAGLRVALEPIHRSLAADFSIVSTIPEALELLDEAGADSVALLFDTGHLWDTPELERHIRENVQRIALVHVADRRPRAGERDERLLPGDGVMPLGPILGWLDEAGYAGWYEIEVYAADSVLGDGFDGTSAAVRAGEVARRARAGLEMVWAEHVDGGSACEEER